MVSQAESAGGLGRCHFPARWGDSSASKVLSATVADIQKEWGFLHSRLFLPWSISSSLQRKAEPPHHHAEMERSSWEGERYHVQGTTQSMGE